MSIKVTIRDAASKPRISKIPADSKKGMDEMSNYTLRNDVKYAHTPYRETVYKISEALNAASIPHELHVRPGYTTIWAHPDLHSEVKEIARRIDQEWIEIL